MKKRQLKGLTLLEMLVVLAIIAILVILIVPKLGGQSQKAEESSGKAIVRVVDNQLELLELEKGEKVSTADLIRDGIIDDKQLKLYDKYKNAQ